MNAKRSPATTDNTAQIGMNAVEAIFLSMKWIFRRQLESDFGIDAQVEIVDDGRPTGQLIAIQIKSGPSFFRESGDDYVFYGERRHLDYWERHSLPVILVLHNPTDGMTLWQRVERHFVTERPNGSWSIIIPRWQALGSNSGRSIQDRIPRSDPQSDRRNRMMLDRELLQRMDQDGYAYVTIAEWVNKGLNFRSAAVSFGDHHGEPAYSVEFYIRAPSPALVFDWLFPWLEFSYVDMPEDDDGEVMEHVFEVKLNDLGKAFLLVEDYYAEGAEPSAHPEISEPTGEIWSDEKMSRYRFEKAQHEDWEAESLERRPDETPSD